MRFLSIDLETTGLDPVKHQIIQIGCVLVDTEQGIRKEFLAYIQHSQITGDIQALAMNAAHLKVMADLPNYESYYYPDEMTLGADLRQWISKSLGLTVHEKIVPAGKNFGSFDLQFIKNSDLWVHMSHAFTHRCIDPAMFYMQATDDRPPNLTECLRRAGLPKPEVSHDALDDANDAADLILFHFASEEEKKKITEEREKRLASLKQTD